MTRSKLLIQEKHKKEVWYTESLLCKQVFMCLWVLSFIYCWLICFLLRQQAVTNLFYVKWISQTPCSAFFTCLWNSNLPQTPSERRKLLRNIVHAQCKVINDPKCWNPAGFLLGLLSSFSASKLPQHQDIMIPEIVQFGGGFTSTKSKTHLGERIHSSTLDGTSKKGLFWLEEWKSFWLRQTELKLLWIKPWCSQILSIYPEWEAVLYFKT